MAHNSSFPADDGFLAEFPAGMREETRAVIEDMIVDAMKVQGLAPGNGSGNIPVSNGNLNINLNAEKHGGKLVSELAAASHTHTVASAGSDGFMSNTDKSKLDGVAASAEVNQNAFSNVLVGNTTIQADAKTDTLELAGGTNIALTPDATNDRVTISVTGKVASASIADTCIGNAATATRASALSNFSVTSRSTTNVNSYLTSGMFALDNLPANAPGSYLAGIAAQNIDVGLQIAGGYNSDALLFRGWWSSGASFSPWRTIIHSGNIGSQSVNYANSASYASSAGSAPANGGTASYATFLNPLSGDNNYKLGYTADGQRTNAGEWGRVVMQYTPNGQTYGVRCDRSDYADSAGNSGTVGGYSAAQLIANSGGIVAASLAQNGYVKFSNGLIFQWGINTGSTGANTFPVTFPNTCLNIIVSIYSGGGENMSKDRVIPRDITNAGFAIYNSGNGIRYLAIGL